MTTTTGAATAGVTETAGIANIPPIQDVIERGQDLLVQVTKEPIGTKGPRVTTQVSLPGRFIVYMPDSKHVGSQSEDRRPGGTDASSEDGA